MNTHADEPILQRIKKLLELAADPANEHEAASAAAHAQRLMFKYNIDQAALESIGKADAKKIERESVEAGYTPGTGMDWRISLAAAIAKYGFGQVIIHGTGKWTRFSFIGRKDDVEAMKATYTYLTVELARLLAEFSKKAWADAKQEARDRLMSFHEWESIYSHRHPLRMKNSWLLGAAMGVSDALRDEQQANVKEAGDAGTALVVIRGTEVADYIKEQYPSLNTRKSNSKQQVDWASIAAGRRAGHAAAGTRGQKKIGAVAQLEG
jgi:hypothetical protein